MNRHASVLCVGEPLIALTPASGGGLQEADQLQLSVGGAELNVAIGLARFGFRTSYAGAIGDDPFGRRIRETLDREGVDTAHLATDPDRPTGFYFKDPGAARTVHYHRDRSAFAELTEIPSAATAVDHLHLTGITPALSEDARKLADRLLRSDCRTSFDINYRSALWEPAVAADVLRELAGLADIVFVGLDEAQTLWGIETPDEAEALLRSNSGQEIVVKNDKHSAIAFAGGERYEVPALPVTVVEPVGAGDAFAAGYLAARLRGYQPDAGLRLGHVSARAVLHVAGDVGPALAPELVEQTLNPPA